MGRLDRLFVEYHLDWMEVIQVGKMGSTMTSSVTEPGGNNVETDQESRLEVGDVVEGKYELVRLIGRGGMGRVFEVRHTLINRRAALKCLHAHLIQDQGIVTRFLHEAQAAAAIGSDYIVDITDAGVTAEGVPYLVMEYLDGEDLSDFIVRQGPLSPERAAHLVLQACRGLIAAHRKGIIHRDLKPENLFLRQVESRERVKILDFGMAKFLDLKLTSSKDTFGSPYYMAPEQFFGARNVDHRADVYSIGVILYEMLTTDLPFKGSSVGELVYQVTMTSPPPPRELRPEIPIGLERIVLKALAAQVEARYQSMADLAADLSGMVKPSQAVVTLSEPDVVEIPAGTFTMGSAETESGRYDDEAAHEVTLTRPYFLFARPVTQAEWQAMMGSNPSHNVGLERPVDMVSWYDAVAYCNALSRACDLDEAYLLEELVGRPGEPGFTAKVTWKGPDNPGFRLPTEAEWEHACRAGCREQVYGVLHDIAWYRGNSPGASQAVGMKSPNDFGLFDMLGNVWEWCWDWYGTYPESSVIDPAGPTSGFGRVDRGGAWDSAAELCRCADRDGSLPAERHHNLGFRPARTVLKDDE